MEQDYGQGTQEYLGIDFSYLLRQTRKNFLVILLCACIMGCVVYVGMDFRLQDSYTATVQLAVIAQDSTTSRQSDSAVNTAVVRYVNVLNSDALKSLVSETLSDTGIAESTGSFSAERVGSTNLISLSATGNSAEYVFRLLKAALDDYPELSDYFGTGYMIQTLISLSAENIAHTQASPVRTTVLSVLLVLAAGLGLTLLHVLLTDKIHCRDQADEMLNISTLGELLFVRKKKGQKALLVTDETTSAVYLEDMDKLTTRVKEKMDALGFRTVLVSSMRENEGKSTVAANLALNLAQRGKKVLLVDSDMRRPALNKIFEVRVRESYSFSDILKGQQEENLDIMKTGGMNVDAGNLMAILQEKAIPEPDKLLESGALARMLNESRETVDYVILDTPPLGIVRDAEIIAATVDAALLVFRQDEIHAGDINDTADILENAGARVIGGVLNMTRGSRSSRRRNGYGYSYGYYGRGR